MLESVCKPAAIASESGLSGLESGRFERSQVSPAGKEQIPVSIFTGALRPDEVFCCFRAPSSRLNASRNLQKPIAVTETARNCARKWAGRQETADAAGGSQLTIPPPGAPDKTCTELVDQDQTQKLLSSR